MKKKIVYLALAGDHLSGGYKNIFKIAKKYGKIVVGLMTDEACIKFTSLDHLESDSRRKLMLENYPDSSIRFQQSTID